MNKIKELVQELPEQYQIIYGYPEFDNNPSRACIDRAELLVDLVQKLINEYKRPLKVLDLGCAQGYFCFRLAELGCDVVGVDFLDKNIAVCKKLSELNPKLKCSFEIGDVVDKIDSINGDFDLVYSFSVLHHVCYARGLDFVKQKMIELSNKCDVFLYEAALSTEPLYWANSLPENAYQLIEHFDFYRELNKYPTHLSDVIRPLYFCSDKYLYLGNNIYKIDNVFYRAHDQARIESLTDSRRYYFSDNVFIKVYYFKGIHHCENLIQLKQEIEVYSSNKLSNLIGYIPSFVSGNILTDLGYVMTTKINGDIISNLQKKNQFIISRDILMALLHFLSKLEESGLYYSDLRTWNLMVDENNELKIIDIASINHNPNDLDCPRNIFISFMLLIYELYHGSLLREDILRQFRISPVWFNQQVGQWMQKLWSIPYNQWSFKLIYDLFEQKLENNAQFEIHPLNIYLWMGVVEEFTYRATSYTNISESIQANKVEITRLHQECANRDGEINKLHVECTNRDAEVNRLHVECANRDAEVNRLTNELSSVNNELSNEKNEVNRLHSEIYLRNVEIERLNNHIHSIYNTLSWKITKPIRLIKIIIKKILLIPKKLILKIKKIIKMMIIKIAKKIATIDIVRRIGKSYLNKHPELKMKIKRKMLEKGLWHDPYMPVSSFPLVNSSDSDMNVEQVRQQYGNDVANVYQILTKKK